MKNLKSWEVITDYDYKTYTVLNTFEKTTTEVCLFDVKVPSIENIREGLKCIG